MTRTLQVAPARRGAYTTIGDALADAPDDAVVEVAAGVYGETLYLVGKRIVVRAADDVETVTIDAHGSSLPAVSASGGALTLEGLTVRAEGGAGVAVERGELRMSNCTVSSQAGTGISVRRGMCELRQCMVNDAVFGIQIEDTDGSIDDCAVSNVTEDGIVVSVGSAPTIGTTTVAGCGNRGVYVYRFAKPTLEACEISSTSGAGIAVAHKCDPTIRRCKVHDTQGVGITFGRGCCGLVEECALQNTAAPAIEVHDEATPTIRERAESWSGTDGDGPCEEEVAALLADLDALVGLEAVKSEVRALIDELQVNEWRRSAGLSVSSGSNNLIFTGPPGTGKTTVARIYGKLLAALGILPGGGFREVARRDLVGQHLGHTAEKTSSVFEEATGGVLFIDEAYTLARSAGSNDVGQESIDTLVRLMEDHRHEIVVIVAGHTRQMSEFLDANPDLASRFSKSVEFVSYQPEDLVVILNRMVGADDYLLSTDTRPALLEYFGQLQDEPGFGNAREARKLFEGMRKEQARRLRRLGHRPSLDDLRTLTVEDMRAVVT